MVVEVLTGNIDHTKSKARRASHSDLYMCVCVRIWYHLHPYSYSIVCINCRNIQMLDHKPPISWWFVQAIKMVKMGDDVLLLNQHCTFLVGVPHLCCFTADDFLHRSSAVRLQCAQACDLSTDHWALQGPWAISQGSPAVREFSGSNPRENLMNRNGSNWFTNVDDCRCRHALICIDLHRFVESISSKRQECEYDVINVNHTIYIYHQ